CEFFIFCRETQRGCRGRFNRCNWRMRKHFVQLACEQELWIHLFHPRAPLLRGRGAQRTIERCINLDEIVESRQILEWRNLAYLEVGWIDGSDPVFVGKTSRA